MNAPRLFEQPTLSPQPAAPDLAVNCAVLSQSLPPLLLHGTVHTCRPLVMLTEVLNDWFAAVERSSRELLYLQRHMSMLHTTTATCQGLHRSLLTRNSWQLARGRQSIFHIVNFWCLIKPAAVYMVETRLVVCSYLVPSGAPSTSRRANSLSAAARRSLVATDPGSADLGSAELP